MKYEVRVGKQFEGEVTVVVAPNENFSFAKAATYVLVTLIICVTSVSLAYGMATNDYTLAKSLAQSGREALDFLVQLGLKNMK